MTTSFVLVRSTVKLAALAHPTERFGRVGSLSPSHRAGLLAALKTISAEVAGDGITINTILPGRIATDRLIENFGSLEAASAVAEEDTPLGRLGTVEEIAAAAAFLCSEKAAYITGTTLAVDGGLGRGV